MSWWHLRRVPAHSSWDGILRFFSLAEDDTDRRDVVASILTLSLGSALLGGAVLTLGWRNRRGALGPSAPSRAGNRRRGGALRGISVHAGRAPACGIRAIQGTAPGGAVRGHHGSIGGDYDWRYDLRALA